MFKPYKFFIKQIELIEWYPGTADEAIVIGQVLKLTSGKLTKADANSSGTQEFVSLIATTGDDTTLLPVIRLQKQIQFHTNVVAGTPAINTTYTVDAAAVGITNTTTNGVFKVDEIVEDGVVGHFVSAMAI